MTHQGKTNWSYLQVQMPWEGWQPCRIGAILFLSAALLAPMWNFAAGGLALSPARVATTRAGILVDYNIATVPYIAQNTLDLRKS